LGATKNKLLYFAARTENDHLDIFFTQSYQYTLEEDAETVYRRLLPTLTQLGFTGSVLAENGFRLGHPWKFSPIPWGDTHLAYLSGYVDTLPPKRIPPLIPGAETEYISRTLTDIRIRPNLFIVILTYLVTVLLLLDLLGIELFWRVNYLLRLTVLFVSEGLLVWVIYIACNGLRKKFESALIPSPQDNLL
jgi:hypothetical protein